MLSYRKESAGASYTMNVQKASTDLIHETAGREIKSLPNQPPPASLSSKAPLSAAPAEMQNTPAVRSAASLITALGLPPDGLSASIVSFVRFFSLPLKPELTAEIRRHVLAVKPAEPEKAVARSRTALSLAAAACKDKGVILSPEGLASYAAKIDSEGEERQSPGGQGRHRRRQDEQEKETSAEKSGAITASAIKKVALETEAKDPLLALLNKLPGKNGRRWIVFPFSFGEDGREFRVSMRILLEGEDRASRMVMDIAENGGDLPRRWLFAIKSAGEIPALDVFVQPSLPPNAHARFERELSQLMGIPCGRVSVKTGFEPFYCESSYADNLLKGINEAV